MIEVSRAERRDKPIFVGTDMFQGSFINVGERSGIGLCDAYSAWKACGYKQPEFIEAVDPDRITLTLNIEVEANGKSNGSNVTNVVNDVVSVTNDVIKGSTD